VNVLVPRPARKLKEPPRSVAGWEQVRATHARLLRDESRLEAQRVERVHFPRSAEEVAAAIQMARRSGRRIAVSGGRTGITGGAVPIGAEEVVSLGELRSPPVVRPSAEGWVVRVAAGTTLAELADALDHGLCEYPEGKPAAPVYYPVDSTETTAQLGGTIATNASGARTLFYGPTRRWVEWLRIVLPDGRILDVRRKQVRAAGGVLVYEQADGGRVELRVPRVTWPGTKNAAGLCLSPDMDAVDLFIGCEGTLGVIVEAELRLAEKPGNRLFLTQFVPGDEPAAQLVRDLKSDESLRLLALEYIGPRALALLREKGRETPAYMEVARVPESARAALYAELAFQDEATLDALYASIRRALESARLDPAESWAGFTERDMDEMKRLRHAVPEAVNAIIGQRRRDVPGLHKVGTDMAVPDEHLPDMLALYRSRVEGAGLDYLIFGHIGDGHVHVNILPRSADELAAAKQLYAEFAREAVRRGGSVAAEHGIGRIKREFLAIQYPPQDIEAMLDIKRAIDPGGVLNPGVLFGDDLAPPAG
jgi:D-lactate dehydrogenase (cytochrome)